MGKRESCRAIVLKNNKLIAMYREKNDKIYYTFPGGGLENNETFEECVVRECNEEFGIKVNPIKEIYRYENETTIQHFFVCDWISGEFGSGNGEEFQADQHKGVYVPSLLPIEDISTKPLMPPEIAKTLVEDLQRNSPYDIDFKTIKI